MNDPDHARAVMDGADEREVSDSRELEPISRDCYGESEPIQVEEAELLPSRQKAGICDSSAVVGPPSARTELRQRVIRIECVAEGDRVRLGRILGLQEGDAVPDSDRDRGREEADVRNP